ncbi:MAG: phosphate acyltransferase PlsX [Candidatus Dormibacteraeota bacterium]|nr:phosphate acyltransferase PlsX [Candidatus Dormibacteraeota bacterium]MBV9524907.1 phosphate acyltransferase PlsX [Candidatus Dormibacteraeota bacterium]
MPDALPIALDAMGGDLAPGEVVRGAVRAVREGDIAIALVGKRDVLVSELSNAGAAGLEDRLTVVDAGDVIEMHEHPATAVRAKRDASIVRACTLVAEGKAAAAVSAGNSGAMLAAALFTVKRSPGVSRPAIGASFPTAAGQTFLLDVGANTDCKPEWLAQFALMGDAYARHMLGVAEPRVALLSNGEEAEKGSELVQAAHPLLAALPLQFVGNVEGKDVFRGAADVVVTDGFTGNIALKTAEGVGEFLFAAISAEARASLGGKVGGALLKPRLRPLRDRVDYRKTGGALLLGVAGEVVIAHGRSDAEAIVNAVHVARRAADAGVSRAVASAIAAARPADEPDAPAGEVRATARVRPPHISEAPDELRSDLPVRPS